MNRIMTKRKRIEGILLSACLLLFFLTGCGEGSLQKGTNLELEKSGGVLVTYIEEFPSDYYDLDELIRMNEEEVAAYNEEVGRDAVEIVSTQADGEIVTLSMHYERLDDYGNMNGGRMFHGTVAQGKNAGYDLNGTYTEVKTGELVATMDWENLAEHHLIVAKGPDAGYTATIHTYKKIVYATTNVNVAEDGKSATIKGDQQTVIVFK